MKLKNNIFIDKVFVCDLLPDTMRPDYEVDTKGRRVVIDKNKDVVVIENGQSSRISLDLLEINSNEEFNDLAIKALLKSCEISNSIVSNMQDAQDILLKRNLVISKILIPQNKQYSINEYMDLCNIFGGWSDKVWHWMNRVDGLQDNEIMFLTDPEYLGVIAIKGNDEQELYGLGIMNTNGVVLVRS